MIKPIKNKPQPKKIEVDLSAEDITVFDVMNVAGDLARIVNDRNDNNHIRLADIQGKMLRTDVDGAIVILEKNFGSMAIIYVSNSKERTFIRYA